MGGYFFTKDTQRDLIKRFALIERKAMMNSTNIKISGGNYAQMGKSCIC